MQALAPWAMATSPGGPMLHVSAERQCQTFLICPMACHSVICDHPQAAETLPQAPHLSSVAPQLVEMEDTLVTFTLALRL